MDRNYYYQKRAQEHQREISQELTTRQLLNDANANPLATKRLKQITLRLRQPRSLSSPYAGSISRASKLLAPNLFNPGELR